MYFLTVEHNRTGVLLVYASDDFDQSRLPSPVLSHQTVDFAPFEGEIHICESGDTWENLIDVVNL